MNEFILDWDGTMFHGENPISGAQTLFKFLSAGDNRIWYLTNNSSRSADEYEDILRLNGLWNNTKCKVVTSGIVTADFLGSQNVNLAYIIGNSSLRKELKEFGVKHTYTGAQAVVVGFDTTITYQKIQKGHELIVSGIPFIATHDDKVCPLENKTLVDCGALVETFIASTKKTPTIIGKPNKPVVEYFRRILKDTKKKNCVMIGDRIETDGKFANLLDVGFINVNDYSSLNDLTVYLKGSS